MKWKLFRRNSTVENQDHAAPVEKITKNKKKKRSGLDSCLTGGETVDEFIFESFEKRGLTSVENKENNTIPKMTKFLGSKKKRLLKSKVNRSCDIVSSDEGLPSTSSGELFSSEENPLAYCPNCQCVVRPIHGKRSLIRTNPWLGDKKRARLSTETTDPMQKSLDSGIFDYPHYNVQLDHDLSLDKEEIEVEVYIETAQEEKRDSFFSDKDDSEGTMDDLTQKRKRRVKRRRKPRKPSVSLAATSVESLEQQHQQQTETSRHNSLHVEIMNEGIVGSGFVPCEVPNVTPVSLSSGGSSLWWDSRVVHLEGSSSSSTLNLSQPLPDYDEMLQLQRMPFYSSDTDFDTPLSDTEEEFDREIHLPPIDYYKWNQAPSKIDQIEESLVEKLHRLTNQKHEIANRYSNPPVALMEEQECFERELQNYRKELLLRALATVRDQLDNQMVRLEESYSSVIDAQVVMAREKFLSAVGTETVTDFYHQEHDAEVVHLPASSDSSNSS